MVGKRKTVMGIDWGRKEAESVIVKLTLNNEEETEMSNQEAIETIRSNYPDGKFTMLRGALDKAIRLLQEEDEREEIVADNPLEAKPKIIVQKGKGSFEYIHVQTIPTSLEDLKLRMKEARGLKMAVNVRQNFFRKDDLLQDTYLLDLYIQGERVFPEPEKPDDLADYLNGEAKDADSER